MTCLLLGCLLAITQVAADRVSDYHGFVRHDFDFMGLPAIIVEPKSPAKSRPWVWRTEFFDVEPQVDLALLGKGFHLVHLQAGNTFGAPFPTYRFSQLYAELRRTRGLDQRVVVEAFSRGGLFGYNWAATNPDKVMAIYGDAPVCDFRTWPYGGQGAQRSESDWTDLMKAYGFPSEGAALAFPFNPVDNLEALAKSKVPIIHVVGTEDEVVPVATNTDVVERRYKNLGGTIAVIRKPGVGHRPHSLKNPKPIVDFILKHQNDSKGAPPSSVTPVPSQESRSMSAGWQGRSWLDQHLDGKRAARDLHPQIVLLGDSITQGWGGQGRRLAGSPGQAAYEKHLAKYSAVQMGISGDRTQHLLWRLEHGALDRATPQVVAVLIGVNNIRGDTPNDIAKGIEAVVRKVQDSCPSAIVLLQAVFPAGATKDHPDRQMVNSVNEQARRLARLPYVRWVDFTSRFLLADGSSDPSKMAKDALHLVPGGYEAWGEALEQEIDRLLVERRALLGTTMAMRESPWNTELGSAQPWR